MIVSLYNVAIKGKSGRGTRRAGCTTSSGARHGCCWGGGGETLLEDGARYGGNSGGDSGKHRTVRGSRGRVRDCVWHVSVGVEEGCECMRVRGERDIDGRMER